MSQDFLFVFFFNLLFVYLLFVYLKKQSKLELKDVAALFQFQLLDRLVGHYAFIEF